MSRYIEMAGRVCGSLSVLRLVGPVEKGKQARWLCLCECGKEHEVNGRDLRHGHTTSCGCKKAEKCAVANTTHGMAGRHNKAPEYRVWAEMIQRCENPTSNRYYSHGARGIKVCKRWRKSFVAFLEDMGRRPEKGLSLERRDNDGNYEPANCCWATKKQQQRNKRTTHWIEAYGERRPLPEWAELCGLKPGTLLARLKAGWDAEKAVKESRHQEARKGRTR